MNLERMKFVLTLLCIEVVILVLYIQFVGYDAGADASDVKNSLLPIRGGYRKEQNDINHFHPSKKLPFGLKFKST
jgi:hypothetical protein